MPISAKDRILFGLPERITFYHPDQIAAMLVVSEEVLFRDVLWLDGRRPGVMPTRRIKAINVADNEAEPQWRIEETELVRWIRLTKFRNYQRGYAKS